MFENVILATDLSPAWDEIVACAGELKALGCSRVILTHVITLKFLMGMEGKLESEAWSRLERQAAQLKAQGLQVNMEMPTGLPAYSLQEVARCRGADLIMVGSHGKQEGILGSMSRPLCTTPQCPSCSFPWTRRLRNRRASAALTVLNFCATYFSRRIFPRSPNGLWGTWKTWLPRELVV
jgi:nucleotide-binding universal stress UspA family protein